MQLVLACATGVCHQHTVNNATEYLDVKNLSDSSYDHRPVVENLSDIFAEEEARRLAEAKAEIAKEDAAWAALSPEEQAAKIAKVEKKWEALEAEAQADLGSEIEEWDDGEEEWEE